jgi:hypothetical protein
MISTWFSVVAGKVVRLISSGAAALRIPPSLLASTTKDRDTVPAGQPTTSQSTDEMLVVLNDEDGFRQCVLIAER